MLSHLVHNAQTAATRTAQTAALGVAAVLVLFVGLGFLTLAGWLLLLTVTTALNAAVILGCIFTGVAMLIFASIAIRGRARKLEIQAELAAAKNDGVANVAMAFMAGITAGQKARS